MPILGVDFGLKKVGLAIARQGLAEPYQVIEFASLSKVIKKIKGVVKEEKIKKIIVGLPEGKMGEESKKFSLSLRKELTVPVILWDETLTTYEARARSIEAGIRRKRRKALEDAYAATLILQDYLWSR